MVAVMGKQRKARRIPLDKHKHAMTSAREWWIVEAPTMAVARVLVEAWPTRTMLPELHAKILAHGKGVR